MDNIEPTPEQQAEMHPAGDSLSLGEQIVKWWIESQPNVTYFDLYKKIDAALAAQAEQQRAPEDCACGRSASEAVGDPLQDHEPTCAVYLQARLRAVEEELNRVTVMYAQDTTRFHDEAHAAERRAAKAETDRDQAKRKTEEIRGYWDRELINEARLIRENDALKAECEKFKAGNAMWFNEAKKANKESEQLCELVASAHAIRCTCLPGARDARCIEIQNIAIRQSNG